MQEEHVEVARGPPVSVAHLEPGRAYPADALPAEADPDVRIALVDDEAEIADRRAPVGAGDEDVAQPILGERRGSAVALRVARDRREELLVDAIAGDRLALIVAVAQVRTVKAGADRAAEAGPVAMLDNQAAPRRESLLPVPGFADRPERLGASPRQAGIGEEPDQAEALEPVLIGRGESGERAPDAVAPAPFDRDPEPGQQRRMVDSAEDCAALDPHRDLAAGDARLEVARPGDVSVFVLGQLLVGHREGDGGPNRRARAVAEDVAHVDFEPGDVEILRQHIDRVIGNEDEPARGGHRDAVIGQSGRGEGQSEQDRDAVHGLRVPCRSRNEKGDKKGAGIPAPSLPLSEKVQASAGRAPLAWAMIALNASPSCIAMSARTLRSRSTPASLRPCMQRP